MRGTVETVSSLNLLGSLVSSNDLGQPHEFLLGDDGEVLLPIEREPLAHRRQGRALAAFRPVASWLCHISRRRTERLFRAAFADRRHAAFHPAAGERE